MRAIPTKTNRSGSNHSARIYRASRSVIEAIESRLLMSTTLAAWAFDTLPPSTSTSTIETSPTPTSGTGTAYTVGMQSGTSGGYLYPATGAALAADASTFLAATGNADSGGNGGSEGGTNGFVWRVESGQDSAAPIGSQGVQFNAPTAGDTGITVQFDMNPSSTGAVAQFAVEYTTDVQDASPVWTNCTQLLAFGPNDTANTQGHVPTLGTSSTNDVYIQNNPASGGNSNILVGDYATITGPLVGGSNTSWLNDLTVALPSTVDNSANFAFRIVNAATGAAETAISGAASPTYKNWRFNDISVTSATSSLSAPTVTTNPANQTVPAGQPVTFKAAGAGSPTPTVQWYKGAVGSGTLISGATSSTYTFTTSDTAADNGTTYYAVFTNSQGTASTTAATLNDPLAAPQITTQPTAQAVLSNASATFTAAASGSPLPTVQWQSSPDNSTWTSIPGATSTSYTTPTTATSQSGAYYRAVFTNSTSSVNSNSVQLTVSAISAIGAWNFDQLTPATNLSPAPSAGVGTALTVGMQTGSSNVNSPGGVYAYPNPNASGSGDISDVMVGALNNGPNDFSSTGSAGDGQAWRVRGNSDGWSSNAAVGSQGAQFSTSTVGFTGITFAFDLDPSSASAPSEVAVEYTTDGTNWLDATNYTTGTAANGTTDGISVATNSSNPNIINGSYFQIANNTDALFWQNGLSVSLPATADNNANFGVRIVNAATGTSEFEVGGTAYPTKGAGNFRFDNVQITGTQTQASATPAITANPTDQTVVAPSPVAFTAAASGFPTPTVQWYTGTPGSGTAIKGATSPSYTFTPTVAQSGTTYYAVFSNGQGAATTTAATLTVSVTPKITTNPVNQTVAAGTTNVTFTAAATGTPTPTVQWEVEAPGATSFTPVSGSDYSGANTSTLTILNAEESLSGNKYEAVFSNSAGSVPTTVATIIVTGTPIAQWEFTSGLGAPGGTSIVQGTGNAPNPTFGPAGSATNGIPDTAFPIGLNNDYTGVEAFPESDVIPLRSTVNASFVEYVWRLRSGNGSGPTGSPGTPEGWSQNAPEYSQGVQFDVDTTGYSNITLHFDWNQGGISNMQPLYSTDGGQTWTVLPNGLITQAAPAGDYYGITPKAPPTGITVNLQGIAGVNNNPNFELRLAAAYDPSLPLITDGNLILNGGNTGIPHGQYATGIAGPVNAQQVIQFGNDENSTTDVTGGTFTLSYNGTTTGTIAFSSDAATLAANITAALTPLIGSGNFTVTQTNPSTLNPIRDALGVTASTMSITFKGALAATPVPPLAADGSGLTGGNPSIIVQDYVNGSASGFSPYVDGGGAWEIGNISFNGFSSNAAGLGITSQPVSTQVAGGGVATFTATAYSEVTPTVVWQVSTDGGNTWNTATGTTSPLTFTSAANNTYTSTFSYTSHTNLSDNGYEFRAVFSAGGSSAASNAATLTVVAPVAPTITLQPTAIAVLVGDVATDSAAATGAPTPTVQWEISNDGGTNWTNIPGATSSKLSFTPTAAQSGDLVRAVFFNAVATSGVSSNAITLSVLSAETDITNWDFNNSQYNATSGFNNSPAPSGGVVGSGTALEVGMNLPYKFNDSASGTDGNGAVADGDITNSASSLNPNFNENTWRIRGGVPSAGGVPAGGTPANGWSNLVPQYTQGLQINVPTTGYQDIYVTLDWFSTHSGELDAQEQYTIGGTTVAVTAASSANNQNIQTGTSGIDDIATLTAPNNFQFGDEVTVSGLPAPYDGTFQIVSATPTTFSYYTSSLGGSWSGTGSAYVPTWINLGNPIQNNTTPSGNDDFYGITATAAPVPVIFDLTGISGVTNNPNFGIRLVNAYDPYLSNTQKLTLGDTNSFTLSFNGQTTASIPYSSNTATEAANIQSALGALSSIGAPNVTVTYNSSASNYSITFGNALGVAAQPPITVSDSGDAIATNYQYANATEVGSPAVPVPYNGSKGNWRFDNIEVHGISIAPIVTSISPTSGPASGGTTVTINGTGFTGATAVDFGSTPATSFTINSSGTQIIAIDPAGSGTVDVTVVTPSGTSAASATDQFTYVSLPAWLASGSAATWDAATHTLTVTGAATIIADPGSDEPNIVASGSSAKLAITPATSPMDVHVGNISLSNGASITMTSVGSARTHNNHNVLVIGTAGASADPTVSIDSSSKLDLGSNDLIVHTGTSDSTGAAELTAWRALAATGRGVAPVGVLNGTWTGNGLTSSAAAAVDAKAGLEQNVLAVVLNSDQILGTDAKWTVGTASETVGAHDILVKYTYNGDAALEGFVGDDSVTIVNGLYDGGKSTQADWAFGDFTGVGQVNDDDITILNGLYGNGTSASGLPQL